MIVDELFAYVGTEIASGKDGLITCVVALYAEHPLPMVFATRRVAEMCEPLVRWSVGHRNIRLVRYAQAEVLKEIR